MIVEVFPERVLIIGEVDLVVVERVLIIGEVDLVVVSGASTTTTSCSPVSWCQLSLCRS